MKTKTDILNYRVVIEQDEEGKYVASVPTLQGCYTEGETYEEVIENIRDVINLHIQARRDALVDDSQSIFIGGKDITIPYGTFATN